MRLDYPCTVTDEGDDGVTVTFRDVPEAITGGDTQAEAIDLAEDALSTALTFYLERGDLPPAPSPAKSGEVVVAPSLLIALKAALLEALRDTNKRPADLARLLETDHKSARRLVDPNYPSKLQALERALTVLGKRVSIETVNKAA